MKNNGTCNYSERLLNYCWDLETAHENISDMLINVLKANDINSMILDEVPAGTDKLLLGDGFIDLVLYHDISRCIRLLSLVGRMPQAVIDEEAEFLFGCPFRYEMMSQTEIEKFGLEEDTEEFDNIWLVFGKFGEIRMAVQMSRYNGTFCPVISVPIQSDYEDESKVCKRELIDKSEREKMADRILYDNNCVFAYDNTYLYVNHKDDVIKEFYRDADDDGKKVFDDWEDGGNGLGDGEEVLDDWEDVGSGLDDGEEVLDDWEDDEEEFDDGEEVFDDWEDDEEEFDDGEEVFDDWEDDEEEFDDGEEVLGNERDEWNCVHRSVKKGNGIYIFIELNHGR